MPAADGDDPAQNAHTKKAYRTFTKQDKIKWQLAAIDAQHLFSICLFVENGKRPVSDGIAENEIVERYTKSFVMRGC